MISSCVLWAAKEPLTVLVLQPHSVVSLFCPDSHLVQHLSDHVCHHDSKFAPLVLLTRYLYVNSRAWPAGCVISDPLYPPPIAEEIDLHVIDLKSLREERRCLHGHRAFTSNNECFFIFLDVSRDFVARWVIQQDMQRSLANVRIGK